MEKLDVEIKNESRKLPQYIAAFSVCLGAFSNGAVTGWTSNISEDMKRLGYNEMEIDNDSLGWIGSMIILGSAVCCVPIAYICNLTGRKSTMMVLVVPACMGWLLTIFAKWLWMIYLGRFLNGMAVGGLCVVLPIYISESIEKTIRGRLGGCFDLFSLLGSLVANTLATFINIKLYTIIVATFPLYFAFTFAFQPESPMYLASKNHDTKAKKSIARLRGMRCDVDMVLENIKNDMAGNRLENQLSFLESIKTTETKKAIFICCSLILLQHIGGLNAIYFFTSSIFESTGVNLNPKISTIIFCAVRTMASFLSANVIDKLGRRVLLIISGLGMGISVGCLAIFFTLRDRLFLDADILTALNFLPLVSLSLYTVSHSFGMGPIIWVLSSELFPSEIKSFGIALLNVVGCLAAFLVTNYYFNIESAIGNDITFYLSSAIAFISVAFVYFCVPETKGKTLAEIQKELIR